MSFVDIDTIMNKYKLTRNQIYQIIAKATESKDVKKWWPVPPNYADENQTSK